MHDYNLRAGKGKNSNSRHPNSPKDDSFPSGENSKKGWDGSAESGTAEWCQQVKVIPWFQGQPVCVIASDFLFPWETYGSRTNLIVKATSECVAVHFVTTTPQKTGWLVTLTFSFSQFRSRVVQDQGTGRLVIWWRSIFWSRDGTQEPCPCVVRKLIALWDFSHQSTDPKHLLPWHNYFQIPIPPSSCYHLKR